MNSLRPASVGEAIDRIAQINPLLRACTSMTHELEADNEPQAGGALAGLSFVVKDNIDVRGALTSCGMSPPYRTEPATTDADAVAKLRAAGAVPIAKSNMPAMAYGLSFTEVPFGFCLNPWNVERWSGGSSNGSAVAVASGMSSFALGTDTGGSIRLPSSLNGVTGIRPTAGLLSLTGIVPLSVTFDTVGPLAGSAIDLMNVFSVLAQDDLSLHPANPQEVRVGIPEQFFFEGVDEEIASSVLSAAHVLEGLGCTIVPVTLQGANDVANAVRVIVASEAADEYAPQVLAGQEFYSYLSDRFVAGSKIPPSEVSAARAWLNEWNSRVEHVFTEVSVLLTPTCARDAPIITSPNLLAEVSDLCRLIPALNATRGPSLSMPSGLHRMSGVPIGISLTAPAGAESIILKLAALYQKHTDWHTHIPTAIA